MTRGFGVVTGAGASIAEFVGGAHGLGAANGHRPVPTGGGGVRVIRVGNLLRTLDVGDTAREVVLDAEERIVHVAGDKPVIQA